MKELARGHPLAGLGPQAVVQRRLDARTLRDAEAACGRPVTEIVAPPGASDRKSLLAAIAGALHFPAWFGGNLDALYDCLSDLSQPQLLALHGVPRSEAGEELIDVFRDVAEDFAQRGIGFVVLYDFDQV